jgi:hypothetical protein
MLILKSHLGAVFCLVALHRDKIESLGQAVNPHYALALRNTCHRGGVQERSRRVMAPALNFGESLVEGRNLVLLRYPQLISRLNRKVNADLSANRYVVHAYGTLANRCKAVLASLTEQPISHVKLGCVSC